MTSLDNKKLLERISFLETEIEKQKNEIQAYQELIQSTNQRLQLLLGDLHYDVNRMQEIQKLIVPKEIKKISGIEFSSRYVPGQKIGGDYFDIFPIGDSQRFAIILSSAGSYGLSALVLSTLISVAPRLEARDNFNLVSNVDKLVKKVLSQLNPQDEWSFFYGVFDKTHSELEYILHGDIQLLVKTPQEVWRQILGHKPRLNHSSQVELQSKKIFLDSLGQLALISSGLQELVKTEKVIKKLNEMENQDLHRLRNEIFVLAQEKQKEADPERDQVAILMQVKDRRIRLAK